MAITTTVVPLRDGTVLDAYLYLPVRPPGERPSPCVVSTNGYAPLSAIGPIVLATTTGPSLEDLARRGYAGAFVFLRGVGVPEDEALYYRYAEDGYDIVEWMAAQPWCDGNVGMIGVSLSGISPWLTARAAPPSLKAIVPQYGCGDCYWYLWYQGGMLPGPGREERTPPLAAYDEYGAAIRHRNYDDWWRVRNTETSDHQAMARNGIAVLHVGGWKDYIHAGGSRAAEEVAAAGGYGAQIIGPWSHAGTNGSPGGIAETLYGNDGLLPYGLQTFTVLWFDRFLKGIDNGIEELGALIYVKGADQYRFEDEWPIPDAHATRLFLRAHPSGSAQSLNDGLLTAAPAAEDESPVGYEYDPEGPYNNAGAGSAPPSGDQRPEERRSLTWTTDVLTVPTEVTGWPALKFWASSSAPDTDFVVEITDVAPDGTSTQVARGWLNGPRFFSRSDPQPLEPGRIYHFALELWPMSYVFAAGNRIRVSLAGSDFGGQPEADETPPGLAPNPHPATVTVYQDAHHSSFVELPVIGTSWRQFEQP